MPHSSQDYIGRYRLLNQLRSGTTCQVWEVMDDTTNKRLAIKLLLADFRRNREEVRFMRHEYKVGRRLEHRRVIKIHEYGIDAKNVYLVMELFPAQNLKQIIHGGHEALAPLARNCILQAAEGLAYLHSQGWIHRDIKPDNYLMKPDGDVKLIDFALAKRCRKGWKRLLFGGYNRLIGRFFQRIQGTRSYMSPEQIRGRRLDERSDVYSFGCMMFELLSGKLPYTGNSTADLLNKHLRLPPPSVQAANKNISDPVAQLLKQMMSKRPRDRPRDMNEFLRSFHGMEVFKIPPAKVRR